MANKNTGPKKSGFASLRKICLRKMLDLGYERSGSLLVLAGKLDVNYRSLSMALTGWRDTPRSIEILSKLRATLDDETSQRGNIHNVKQIIN
jgi:hypothetical protein